MELFVLGLVVGGAFGAKGKKAVKVAAKGALSVAEKAKEVFANVREDFRDAVEEAHFEREADLAAKAQRDAAGPASNGSNGHVETVVAAGNGASADGAKSTASAAAPASSMDAVLEAVVGPSARSARSRSAAPKAADKAPESAAE